MIRENPALIEQALIDRNSKDGLELLQKVLSVDQEWRKVKKEEEQLRSERNKLSMEINSKKKAGESTTGEIVRSGEIAKRIKEISAETSTLEDQIKDHLLMVPNIPDEQISLTRLY